MPRASAGAFVMPSSPDALLAASRELAAIAQAGLHYAKDPFDQERFARVLEIAGGLLQQTDVTADFAWPVELGHPTPKVDVRAVVFRENQVLLVKERSSGLWTVPGGWCDVNLSPAQNAEKECREESGFEAKALAITSVRDRDAAGYATHPHAIYKIHILCRLVGGEARPSNETSDVGFFALDGLPPLDPSRSREDEIRLAFEFLADPHRPAAFN